MYSYIVNVCFSSQTLKWTQSGTFGYMLTESEIKNQYQQVSVQESVETVKAFFDLSCLLLCSSCLLVFLCWFFERL